MSILADAYNDFSNLFGTKPEQLKESHFYYIALSSNIPREQALKITDYNQIDALEAGATLEEALYKNGYPFLAEQAGATKDQASLFENFYQLKALKAGASAEAAVNFNNIPQINALSKVASTEEALMFSNEFQLQALEEGAALDIALRFNSKYQIATLKAGASVNEALSGNGPIFAKLIAEKENFIKLIENKFEECEAVRPNIYSGIKDMMMYSLNNEINLQSMKWIVKESFENPLDYDTGECSEIFMNAINNYKPLGTLATSGDDTIINYDL